MRFYYKETSKVYSVVRCLRTNKFSNTPTTRSTYLVRRLAHTHKIIPQPMRKEEAEPFNLVQVAPRRGDAHRDESGEDANGGSFVLALLQPDQHKVRVTRWLGVQCHNQSKRDGYTADAPIVEEQKGEVSTPIRNAK